jgi:hypothetical protein
VLILSGKGGEMTVMKQQVTFPVGSAVRVLEPEYVECDNCNGRSKPYGAVGVVIKRSEGEDTYIVRFDSGDEAAFHGMELERVDMW